MHPFKKFFPCFFFFFFALSYGLRPAMAVSGFDQSEWDAFLKKYVNGKGEVNYQAVKNDPKALDDYLAKLVAVKDTDMRQWPREESLAFWLNAYHATLIKLVIEHYPVTSVQKIPSFWDIALISHGAGKDLKYHSLNDIRVVDLMGVYHSEKIQLALSLAAKGGPKLSREAFTGLKVEGQLFLLTRKFVNDPFYVDVTPGRKKIRLSKIFKWYAKDFKLNFGIPEPLEKFSDTETAVLSFLAYYLEDEAKGEFLQQGNFKIEYPPFDWSLNDQKGSTS